MGVGGRILFAVGIGAALGCITTPGRNARCIYPGDTVSVAVAVSLDRHVTSCAWIIADSVTCGLTEYFARTRPRCAIGDTVP
jgi:hypothetical protein